MNRNKSVCMVWLGIILLLIGVIVTPNAYGLFQARVLTTDEKNTAEKDYSSIIHLCADRLHNSIDSGKICDAFMTYFIDQCDKLDNLLSYCNLSDEKYDLENLIRSYQNKPILNLARFYEIYRTIQLACLNHDNVISTSVVCEEFANSLGSIAEGYKRIEMTKPHVQIRYSIPHNITYAGSPPPILGEIVNNYSYPIENPQILVTFFDKGGIATETEHVYTQDDYLKPNQASGFSVESGAYLFLFPSLYVKYVLTTMFTKAIDQKPEGLKMEITGTSLNPIEVQGSVTNLGNKTATAVKVTGVFYDANHTVIAVGESNNITALLPKAKSTFALNPSPSINFNSRNEIKSYTLSVQSSEYSVIPAASSTTKK